MYRDALGARGNWMGCWILYYYKRLTSEAVSGKELALLPSLPLLCPSRQTAPLSDLRYYPKPCIYRAIDRVSRLFPSLLKEPDYSCFPLLSGQGAGYCRQEPPFDSSLPAAAHLCCHSTRAGQTGCITWRPVSPGFARGSWIYPTLAFLGRR